MPDNVLDIPRGGNNLRRTGISKEGGKHYDVYNNKIT